MNIVCRNVGQLSHVRIEDPATINFWKVEDPDTCAFLGLLKAANPSSLYMEGVCPLFRVEQNLYPDLQLGREITAVAPRLRSLELHINTAISLPRNGVPLLVSDHYWHMVQSHI